jgi:nitrate reductase NapAB chaperone NapD
VIIAGVVIETMPGEAGPVAARLARIEGLTIHGGDGDRRLAAVWSAQSGEVFEHEAEQLLRADESIVGIFPTFVGLDDETGTDDAASDAV